MTGYLGETTIDWKTHPKFKDMNSSDWALLYIELYAGYDGSHHKDWVIDQVARILNGAEVVVSEGKWDNGDSEFRFSVGTNQQYIDWVAKVKNGEDGHETYSYEEGIAP